MTATIQDIQVVLSLRKSIREPTAPSSILALIDTIHQSIASSSEQNGWKTVDWRGNGSGGHGNHGNGGGRSNAQHSRGNYGSNRQSYSSNRESASHSAFGNRSRTAQETSSSTTTSGTSSPVVTTTTNTGATSHGASHGTSHGTSHKQHTWQENSDGFRHPHQKYVSKFKKSSEKVEDTILNTILLGKLNKFSQSNYNEIKEFITHIIDSGQTEMIKCFMKLVFEKAASEEMFCPLYAKLLSELSTKYPVLLTEMDNLYTQYMEIFDEVSEDITSETYNEMCKRNVEKKYRRGYSQFLAELIKHDVIDGDTFMKSINKIISQVESKKTCVDSIKLNEEYADCLMKIIKAICSDTAADSDSDDETERKITAIRITLKNNVSARIEPLSVRQPDTGGLSNKSRFTFLDIYERIQKH